MLYMLHVRSFYECSTNYKYEKSQKQNIVLTELKTLVRVLNIHSDFLLSFEYQCWVPTNESSSNGLRAKFLLIGCLVSAIDTLIG